MTTTTTSSPLPTATTTTTTTLPPPPPQQESTSPKNIPITKKQVTLVAADQKEMLVAMDVACQSKLVADVLIDDDPNNESLPAIPLPNVRIETLSLVIEFCTRQVVDPSPKIEKPIMSVDMAGIVNREDADFINSLNQEQLFDVILAANYLDIDALLDLGCAKVASMMKGKTPDQVRKQFNILEPTPEEEIELKRDHQWIIQQSRQPVTS